MQAELTCPLRTESATKNFFVQGFPSSIGSSVDFLREQNFISLDAIRDAEIPCKIIITIQNTLRSEFAITSSTVN